MKSARRCAKGGAERRLLHIVLGLGEVGELEAQMFDLAQMYNRIPNVQFCTSAPILPNPC
ncbi:hypothetical protein [Chryseobacterium piscicola]|nr:hypothetical protein [Chryseobacterium piscicola]